MKQSKHFCPWWTCCSSKCRFVCLLVFINCHYTTGSNSSWWKIITPITPSTFATFAQSLFVQWTRSHYKRPSTAYDGATQIFVIDPNSKCKSVSRANRLQLVSYQLVSPRSGTRLHSGTEPKKQTIMWRSSPYQIRSLPYQYYKTEILPLLKQNQGY